MADCFQKATTSGPYAWPATFAQAFSHVGLINTAMNLTSWRAPAAGRSSG
jgi:hypothetical protein